MYGYIGEVKMFAGTYPPDGWAFCQGQLMKVSQYSSLFAVIGTGYGGDGRVSFGLPDLRGRVPVGSGDAPGMTPKYQGQHGGYERVLLTEANLPSHQHAIQASTKKADIKVPSGNAVLATQDRKEGINIYAEGDDTLEMKPTVSCGGGQQIENMQPWLCLNYIICLVGDWPSRS